MKVSPKINLIEVCFTKLDGLYIPQEDDKYIDENDGIWFVKSVTKDSTIMLDCYAERYIVSLENVLGGFCPKELYERTINIDHVINDSLTFYGALEGSKSDVLVKGFGDIEVLGIPKKSWVCRAVDASNLQIAIGPRIKNYNDFYQAELNEFVKFASSTMPVELIVNTLTEMVKKGYKNHDF